MDKSRYKELISLKADVEIVEKGLDKMLEELRGKNRDLYTKDLTENEKYKRAIEVSAQLLKCYKFKNELSRRLESV